jgi:hypothetical protein|tara:strand:+ start:525 stop:788 length:264 start_codon:yes stop_codon:yes gene_type:complete
MNSNEMFAEFNHIFKSAMERDKVTLFQDDHGGNIAKEIYYKISSLEEFVCELPFLNKEFKEEFTDLLYKELGRKLWISCNNSQYRRR